MIVNTEEILGNLRVLLAGNSGFEHADVCIRHARSMNIGAHQSRLEDLSESSNLEIALRLQNAQACIVLRSSESEKSALKTLVNQGLSLLRSAKTGPIQPIVPCESAAPSMDERSEASTEIPKEEKIQRVLNLVSNIMKNPDSPLEEVYGKYVETEVSERYWTLGSQKSLYLKKSWNELRTRSLARLHGREPFLEICEEKPHYFDLDWTAVARKSAQLAWSLRDSKSIASGQYRCLVDNAIVIRFLYLLGQQLQGNRVARGLSCFKRDEISKPLMSTKVTVFDQPQDFKRSGFRPFDSEGFPTQRNFFVRNGILENFSVDAASAKDLGIPRNGQATRDDLSQHPQPGFHNLTIEPGSVDFVDLERELGFGLRLVSVDAFELIQPRTGQFLASFSGFLMDKGQIQHPFSRILVRGDLQSFFSNIIALDRDLVSRGRCAAPAVLLDSIRVVGEGN